MSSRSTDPRDGTITLDRTSDIAHRVESVGRGIAIVGVVLPLALIGILKFTQYEIDMLQPLISGTPWLAWLHAVFGEALTSYLLGVVELMTAVLLIVSFWSGRAALAGGALGALTFATTSSTMLALPIWEPTLGGFPWLNPTGSFLIKDVTLLGVSLVVFAEGLARTRIGVR